MSEYQGKRRRATVRVPTSLKVRLEALALAKGISVNSLIIEALDREVRRNTGEHRDQA
jgi:predicted HicB family RNase H-like nuclease